MRSMMIPVTTVIYVFLALECIHLIAAQESGTAQCNSGSASVDDPSAPNGSISDAATVFRVNGIDLTTDKPYPFLAGEDLVWSLEAQRFAFTGFLVRFESDPTNSIRSAPITVILEDDRRDDETGLQSSPACAALLLPAAIVLGVTHTTSDPKVFANGTVTFGSAGNITIDVTLIFTDENSTELYAYDQFILSIEGVSDPPSLAPSLTPSLEQTMESIVPSDVPSLAPMAVETDSPGTDAPVAPVTNPPVGVMDKCIKMGKGMGKGKGKGKGTKDKKGKKGMKGEMDKKGKKGEADDDSEGEEESGDERLLKTGGKATYDPCETEAPSEYPSAAPSAYPSAAPTASPTPEPTKGKGKGKMDKEGMKDSKAMGDKKGKGDKGGKGKGKGEETEAPTDEPTAAAPTDDEPAPEEPKGKGGKGKGGKGYTDEPTPAPTLEPTVADTPEPTGKGKGGKGGKGKAM